MLSIHTDAGQAQRSIDYTAAITTAFGIEAVHLTGPNWSVNCGSNVSLCKRFAETLAGEVQMMSADDR